jgi:hypothetical protein
LQIRGRLEAIENLGQPSALLRDGVVRDEQAVLPIGVFNPKFGVTLSMPGILGRSYQPDPGTRDDRGRTSRAAAERQ